MLAMPQFLQPVVSFWGGVVTVQAGIYSGGILFILSTILIGLQFGMPRTSLISTFLLPGIS